MAEQVPRVAEMARRTGRAWCIRLRGRKTQICNKYCQHQVTRRRKRKYMETRPTNGPRAPATFQVLPETRLKDLGLGFSWILRF
jgi:hypothetical protein